MQCIFCGNENEAQLATIGGDFFLSVVACNSDYGCKRKEVELTPTQKIEAIKHATEMYELLVILWSERIRGKEEMRHASYAIDGLLTAVDGKPR